MKNKKMFDAITDIDDELIEEAKKSKIKAWKKKNLRFSS